MKKGREEHIFLGKMKTSIGQTERDMAEYRQKEKEMKAYGRKWGGYAMRRKYPLAKARAEDTKRRKIQDTPIVRIDGTREKSDGMCIVM